MSSWQLATILCAPVQHGPGEWEPAGHSTAHTHFFPAQLCTACREAGDAGSKWSFMPKDKQFLITRTGQPG